MTNEIILEDFINRGKEDLEKINKILTKFNGFEITKQVRKEEIHSNIIAWFLNPKESHNLGNNFLIFFLKKFMPNHEYYQKADFNDIQVTRERKLNGKSIDIFIHSENNELIIGFENKIDSREGKGQLDNYFNAIQKEFPNYKTNYLFIVHQKVHYQVMKKTGLLLIIMI